MNQGWKKGSFTIEAAVIIPFFLFIMIYILQMGIGFYQESVIRQSLIQISEFDAVSLFYKIQKIGEIGEEFVKNGR